MNREIYKDGDDPKFEDGEVVEVYFSKTNEYLEGIVIGSYEDMDIRLWIIDFGDNKWWEEIFNKDNNVKFPYKFRSMAVRQRLIVKRESDKDI